MYFLFKPRKAAQAAAYLVHLSGGQMSVLSLIKILYLADRRSLVTRGLPITGDQMVSMPHGPVLSRIYDEIKWGQGEGQAQPWYEYLTERQENQISIRPPGPPPTDELSDFERNVLEEMHRNYGHFHPWALRRITHGLPEYTDPQGSSLPIDPVNILRQEGWPDSDIQDALMSAREEVFLNELGIARA